MEWTTVNFLACTLFISVGALMQGVTGLGAGLVAVPMLALVSYSLVPGPIIFASLVLSSLMAFRGRANIDFNNTGMLVERAVEIIERLGARVVGPDEARTKLGLA